MKFWQTPHGKIFACLVEEYTGLRGQPRLMLVDKAGRVFHYDKSEVS